MATFPYTTVPTRIGPLLGKIRDVGIPTKADSAWLKTIGFVGTNDGTLLRVIKFIDLVDGSNVPTERWKSYRGGSHRKILADAIRSGYDALFSTFPNANQRTEPELTNFFSQHTTSGKIVVSHTVATFRNLCSNADFDNTTHEIEPAAGPSIAPERWNNDREFGTGEPRRSGRESNVVININVQLTLPESEKEDVYDRLFAAMRKHLFSGTGELS